MMPDQLTSNAARLGAMALALMASGATCGGTVITVMDDISVSTTWTANNEYRLVDRIHVQNGATLTIEPGTLITVDPAIAGYMIVARGSRLMAKGTAEAPIIFTSVNDNFESWQELTNEWGGLHICGDALISDMQPGNGPSCGANISPLEGLLGAFPGDMRYFFGGVNDEDNSGCLEYVSIRYAGRAIDSLVDQNALTLGGIGRGTDVSFIDVMNGVDDGVEILGGTVNVHNLNIWNVGDDSFDCDKGWRGKGQFIFLVQGHCRDAAQGTGVGDNAFELDGANDSDYQPVTTATIYNATVIGQPIDGDGGTAWRDNARVQFRQSIFMDLGDELIRFDDLDGNGANGYGHNGTLMWPETWSTPFDMVPFHPNDCGPGVYQAQTDGHLADMRDCVFFRNIELNAYDESDFLGVTIGGVGNPTLDNVVPLFDISDPDANMPIVSLTRGAGIMRGMRIVVPVATIDPRAANDAVVSASTAPNDGFYTPVTYRGAFPPDSNWICGWTAAWQYGFVTEPPTGCDAPAPCQAANIATDGTSVNAVDFTDLALLLGCWGPVVPGCEGADIIVSGSIDFDDLAALLGFWGPCP